LWLFHSSNLSSQPLSLQIFLQNFFSRLGSQQFSAIERAEGRVGGRDGEDEVDGGVDEEVGRGDETKRRAPGTNDSKTSC